MSIIVPWSIPRVFAILTSSRISQQASFIAFPPCPFLALSIPGHVRHFVGAFPAQAYTRVALPVFAVSAAFYCVGVVLHGGIASPSIKSRNSALQSGHRSYSMKKPLSSFVLRRAVVITSFVRRKPAFPGAILFSHLSHILWFILITPSSAGSAYVARLPLPAPCNSSPVLPGSTGYTSRRSLSFRSHSGIGFCNHTLLFPATLR